MSFLSKELKPYFKLSLGFHLFLFLFFGVKVLIFPDLSDLDQDGTLKVDMVALPNKEDNKVLTKEKEAPKEEEIKPEIKPEKKPEPKVAEKKPDLKPSPKAAPKKPEAPKIVDESGAFQKLKELEAMKRLETAQTQEVAKQAQEEAETAAIKGNRVAVGDSITGLNKIQYTNYKVILYEAVKNKWNLPSWIQDGNLFAEALVKISETGHITEMNLTTSSGNTMYDKYVLEAITSASPFPAPPDKFVNIVGVRGVVLRFP